MNILFIVAQFEQEGNSALLWRLIGEIIPRNCPLKVSSDHLIEYVISPFSDILKSLLGRVMVWR